MPAWPDVASSINDQDVDNPEVADAANLVTALLGPSFNRQAIAYGATITPVLSAGELIVVGALTGAITIANPVVAPRTGKKVAITVLQDGTGGRAITWGNKFLTKTHPMLVQAVGANPMTAVTANTAAEQSTVAVGAELAAGDVITGVSKPTAQAGLGVVGVRNAGSGNAGITFGNFTTASITPTAAETYSFTVMKASGQPSQAASARSIFVFEYDATLDKYIEVAAALKVA